MLTADAMSTADALKVLGGTLIMILAVLAVLSANSKEGE